MVMDVPEEVLEQLKCPECDMYLSQSPVYLRRDGAAACGGCFSPKRPATRNTHYEAIARLVRFPCRNRELGCRETVGFAVEGQEVAHEATCEYRQYVCPVLGSARCDWLGPRSQILQHCRAQHPDHLETCTGCGAGVVAVMLYRDEGGWRCERCAPARRACANEARGCAHQDIPSKCWKHDLYFCQQRTECNICPGYAPVSRGTLSAHYASAHRDVTYSAGSTWRATGEGYCLVICPAGTAVCRYTLVDSSKFILSVYIPVESERLCEFRCEVRVTNPTTRLTRTYTPDISYNGILDWRIHINEEDFPISNLFDVSVNISKG